MADIPQTERVALPVTPFLVAAGVIPALCAVVWGAVTTILDRSRTEVIGGVIGAGVVGVCTALAVIAIRPWVPKSLMTWPFIWMSSSLLRAVVTIGVTLLIYSATQFGTVSLWLAVGMTYVATLTGETRVYAAAMGKACGGRPPRAHSPEDPVNG